VLICRSRPWRYTPHCDSGRTPAEEVHDQDQE
jgi:hypothetical protein